MKFGLSVEEYNFILEKVVRPLRESDAEIWCYGSRARGNFNKFSDLDLMVESEADLNRQINDILEQLSKSNFPYKVDLVLLSEFADTYVGGYEKDKIRFQ